MYVWMDVWICLLVCECLQQQQDEEEGGIQLLSVEKANNDADTVLMGLLGGMYVCMYGWMDEQIAG